jgi:predicted GNAT family N-acyltransferase
VLKALDAARVLLRAAIENADSEKERRLCLLAYNRVNDVLRVYGYLVETVDQAEDKIAALNMLCDADVAAFTAPHVLKR